MVILYQEMPAKESATYLKSKVFFNEMVNQAGYQGKLIVESVSDVPIGFKVKAACVSKRRNTFSVSRIALTLHSVPETRAQRRDRTLWERLTPILAIFRT